MANYKRFDFKKLYFILYIVLVLIVVYLLFKLGIFLFPFTLALFFSIMTQPFSRFLEKKLKFSQKIATIVSIVLFLVIFLGFISLSALRLSGEIYKLSINLNKYSKEAQSLWNTAIDKVYSLLGYFPEGFDEQVKSSKRIYQNGDFKARFLHKQPYKLYYINTNNNTLYLYYNTFNVFYKSG